MNHTPCEYIVWHGLPVIRKEIVRSLVNDYGLTQRQSARLIGITPSAVSQYLSGKRGKIDIVDKEVLDEIKKSAGKIIEDGEDAFLTETCKLCKMLSSKEIFPYICDFCRGEDEKSK